MVTIQNPPVNMTITTDTPFTMEYTSKIVNFTLTFHGVDDDLPTDVAITADYGDDKNETLVVKFNNQSQFIFEHEYDRYGTYHAKFNMSNYVGWQRIEQIVDCDEAIVPGYYNISHRVAQVGEEVTVLVVIDKGTRVLIRLYWTDATDTAYVTENRTFIYFNHTYVKDGKYSVVIKYNNTVSSDQRILDDEKIIGRNVVVQHPVVGFSIRMPTINNITANSSVLVPTMLAIHSNATTPTNPSVAIDYGDGSAPSKVSFSCTSRYLSTTTTSTTTTTTTNTSTTTTTIAATTPPGLNFTTIADRNSTLVANTSAVGDLNSTTSVNTSATGDPPTAVIPKDNCYEMPGHVFKRGKFKITAKIENLVSEVTVYKEIGVYVAVTGPKILATYVAREEDGGQLEEGKGPNKDVFPMYPGKDTLLQATVEDGNYLRYTWDFGDKTEIEVTTSDKITHLFKSPVTYTVRVAIDNFISNATATRNITIYKPVGKAKIASEISTSINVSFTFKFTLDEIGTNACYRMDFNNERGIGFHRFVVIGSEKYCREFYPKVTNRIDLPEDFEKKKIISISNLFTHRLTAMTRFEAQNYVSFWNKTRFKMIVILGPCTKPNLEIMNKPTKVNEMNCKNALCEGKNYKEITLENSRKIRLTPSCTEFNCTFRGVVGRWRVDCAIDNVNEKLQDCTDKFFDGDEKNSFKDLQMKGGKLQPWPLGYYEIKYKCCMTLEKDLCTLDVDYAIYLRVVPSPLTAAFSTGLFRQALFKTSIRYECDDPALIKDPDAKEGHEQDGITFRWSGRHSSSASKHFIRNVDPGRNFV
jgi:hypothetical protein